jgi:bifunctional enzyme CysN/CysC/sulfate adenylyltransferase subunit 1
MQTTHPIELLRFNTCGSVDDGKSTLIGRLLYDSKILMEDQLEALERSADLTGGGQVNLANLTDGLRSEREQGITIDVAYRYFATPRRKFIVADTPGHVQYTRNMVTGASTANLSVVLVDARNGVIEQTRRHTCISAMLGIPHIVFAVNKMDLVDWSQERFLEIREEIEGFLPKLDSFKDVQFIPMSALEGENVVERSGKIPWYTGPCLLSYLEAVHIASDWSLGAFRMPIQWVNRPNNPTDPDLHDFRGLSGQIAGGIVRVGDEVMIAPSGLKSKVKKIWTYDGELDEAFCPQSVTILLEDDIDASRGDTVTDVETLPGKSSDVRARICWMSPRPLQQGRKYFLKHGSQTVQAMVSSLEYRIDIQTYGHDSDVTELNLNDMGEVRIRTSNPLVFDEYAVNRLTGSFILVEQGSNQTVAAGMLHPANAPFVADYTDFAI